MVKQNIKQLLIGTNNSGKLTEIRDLLPKYIKTFSTLDLKLKSPKENGKTFEQNSLIKSKYFSKKTGLICLADDSGLEIDILKKKPGIYSARWGGKSGDFKKAIKKVYIELRKKKIEGSDIYNICSNKPIHLKKVIKLLIPHAPTVKIKKLGLAKGGSLENAVVVDKDKVLNSEGLRNSYEFVNHKILDLAGDFLLSGYRVLGKVRCDQGGPP